MNSISFWLPFPPSVNNLFSQGFVNGRMRRFPSAKYKSWRKHAWLVIKAAKLPRFTVPVDLTIELVAPDKRPRDADNHNKGIVDSLVENGVLQGDDQRYVRSVHAAWIDHPEKGWAKVTITPVSGSIRRRYRTAQAATVQQAIQAGAAARSSRCDQTGKLTG